MIEPRGLGLQARLVLNVLPADLSAEVRERVLRSAEAALTGRRTEASGLLLLLLRSRAEAALLGLTEAALLRLTEATLRGRSRAEAALLGLTVSTLRGRSRAEAALLGLTEAALRRRSRAEATLLGLTEAALLRLTERGLLRLLRSAEATLLRLAEAALLRLTEAALLRLLRSAEAAHLRGCAEACLRLVVAALLGLLTVARLLAVTLVGIRLTGLSGLTGLTGPTATAGGHPPPGGYPPPPCMMIDPFVIRAARSTCGVDGIASERDSTFAGSADAVNNLLSLATSQKIVRRARHPMTERAEITVTVNGEARRAPEGITVRELLDQLGVRGAAAVERNLELVPRARHTTERIAEGDRFEVVQLVGGG